MKALDVCIIPPLNTAEFSIIIDIICPLRKKVVKIVFY